MKLTKDVADGVTTFCVVGDIDLLTAAELRKAGIAEFESGTCSTLILDLAGVAFMDSTGLAALLGIGLAADKAQKQLILRAPSDAVYYVLDAGGLGAEFTVQER